ncbi:MAG: hypothetical protein ABFD92_09950 [Planctomycetaceae bacterium]|nr:hypothetical protein [Planctomycetaceae bacterium]
MPPKHAIEFVASLQTLDRCELIRLLRGIQCDFDMDFTDDFLNSISVERLRHILTAASLHATNLGPHSQAGTS